MAKRTQQVEKLNLSEHVLDINIRKCSYEKFRFSDIEDYVRAVTGGREYQFQAVKHTMIYLWGGGYENVTDLAKENFTKKEQIRGRFGSEELMLGNLPLPQRLSGVVHMATGTGKSFAMFLVAYLSVVMGLTSRVLVLGPSSTIIEEGLRDKFRGFIDKKEWNDLLPSEYQGKAVNLLTDNDEIGDDSIVIENINAVFTFGGVWDTMFKDTEDVLVLSDEVHHAYSHLKFNPQETELELDVAIGKEGTGDAGSERLWMQFLMGIGRYASGDYRNADGTHKIKRHIGFTGTPYNGDQYFADVIFDYNISTAIQEKFIKDIDPILDVKTEENEKMKWTSERRFEVVVQKHQELSEKYAYRKDGVRLVKPVTVFYCPTKKSAQDRTNEFISFLARYQKESSDKTIPQLEQEMREKVICVITGVAESEYKAKLDNIEETDPGKVGGQVEFIFSVGKLLEGWDVDNVFQIVPMEERVFNSKLLISQVIGRGLRVPRKVSHGEILNNYPMLTVTNHERFAEHIQELMDAVTHSDLHISSQALQTTDAREREKHHFSLFNLNYLASSKQVDADPEQKELPSRTLELTKFDVTEKITIVRTHGSGDKYALKKKLVTVDSVVDALHRRFKSREHEQIHFDFGSGLIERCPSETEIRNKILSAMETAGIPSNQLTEENKKQIELYFNQFLPKGTKKRVFMNVEGDLVPIATKSLPRESVRVGELERDAAAYLSEDYESELDTKSKLVLEHLQTTRGEITQSTLAFVDPNNFLGKHNDYVRPLVENDARPPYIVNTSVFKNPQSSVLVSHTPEKEFVFGLLEQERYISAWIKSPDKGFYSLDYEYWKGGKDRMRRSFNPDFFIKVELGAYIDAVTKNGASTEELFKLQEQGVEQIIFAIEIKSDEDADEATKPKAEWAIAHFQNLNAKLRQINPVDLPEEFQADANQHYIFELLKPKDFGRWFNNLTQGVVADNSKTKE
jgi:type III restriction enzyme